MILPVRQRVGDGVLRWRHRGRIGFEEQPVGRHTAERLDDPGLAGVEEVPGKGKTGTVWHQLIDEFGTTAVGVEKEAAPGWWLAVEGIEKGAPCLEGVDGDGEIPLAGQGELREKDLELELDLR